MKENTATLKRLSSACYERGVCFLLIFFLHGMLQIRTFREQIGGVFIAVGSSAALSQ